MKPRDLAVLSLLALAALFALAALGLAWADAGLPQLIDPACNPCTR